MDRRTLLTGVAGLAATAVVGGTATAVPPTGKPSRGPKPKPTPTPTPPRTHVKTFTDGVGLREYSIVVGTPGGGSDWPDATNTGVPVGTSLTPSGSVTANTPGAVVEDLDISGLVQIQANNVTMRRCRIRADWAFTIVIVDSSTSGVLIEDCEIDGFGVASLVEGSVGVSGTPTLSRVNLHGVENGVNPDDNAVIKDCFIHSFGAPGSPHYDGIQMDGGQNNILIQHNTIELDQTQTAAVMINNADNPSDDIRVINNKLSGGTYTIYADEDLHGTNQITNVLIQDNVIYGWTFGAGLIRGASVTWTGNVDLSGNPV